MLGTKDLEKMYHSQNISIRKNIRQIDMKLTQLVSESSQKIKKSDINILVVGPKESGKTNLLRTMAYAYNGYPNLITQSKQYGHSLYSQIQIKKAKKSIVEGLSRVREIDQKIGIYGYECIYQHQTKNSLQKYSKAMEILSSKVLGCIKETTNSSAMTICLVCISMVDKMSLEELNSIKFFISNLEDYKVKYMVIGTKIDQILHESMDENLEQEKLIYMDEWCSFIMKELSLKDRNDIMCVQNYTSFQKEKQVNSEIVNFYALNLLQKCIKKSEEAQLEKRKSKKSFWFCTC